MATNNLISAVSYHIAPSWWGDQTVEHWHSIKTQMFHQRRSYRKILSHYTCSGKCQKKTIFRNDIRLFERQ